MQRYIPLGRTFSEVDPSEGDADFQYIRAARRMRGVVLDWAWLLNARVSVILNTAGSGKTAELRAQERELDQPIRPAFFAPIERLWRVPLPDALEDDTERQKLAAWRSHPKQEAVFLLDAVDEAKLPQERSANPLNDALASLERFAGDDIRRARIVISSRPEWRREVELSTVERLEARLKSLGVTTTPEPDPSDPKNKDATTPAPIVRYASLDPLSETQVELLAEANEAATGFMAALRAHDALDLVQTPLDVEDMVAAHKEAVERGEPSDEVFGSLSKVVERSIDRRLREEGSGQRRNRVPLPRALQGAKRMAGACVFGLNLYLKEVGVAGEGLDPETALLGLTPDWSPDEIRQVMATGLFDPGYLGRVRFHHRRSMEWLSARWLHDLMSSGCPLKTVVDLLIPEAFEVRRVPEAYLETAAWLASLHDGFRREAIKSAPELLIGFGDPGALPIEDRVAALKAFVAGYGERQETGARFSPVMLKRFAAQPLTEPLVEFLSHRNTPAEAKRVLLAIAEAGVLRGVAAAASSIARSGEDELSERRAALRCLRVIAEPRVCKALALDLIDKGLSSALLGQGSEHERNAFRLEIMSLAPIGEFDDARLKALITSFERPSDHMISGHPQSIQAIAAACPASRRLALFTALDEVVWIDRHAAIKRHDPGQLAQVGPLFAPALIQVIVELFGAGNSPTATPQLRTLLRLASLRDIYFERYDYDLKEALKALAGIVRHSPHLRQALITTLTADEPNGAEAAHLMDSACAPETFDEIRRRAEQDAAWGAQQYKSAPAAMRDFWPNWIWWNGRWLKSGAFRPIAFGVAWAAIGKKDWKTFQRFRWRPFLPLVRLFNRFDHHHRVMMKQKLKAGLAKVRQWARDRWNIWRSWEELKQGRATDLAIRLCYVRTQSFEVWATLHETYGPRLAHVLRENAKTFARTRAEFTVDPERHTYGDGYFEAGWSLIALDEPDFVATMTADDADRAIAAAISQFGTAPDWLTAVAQAHPDRWLAMLSEPFSKALAQASQPEAPQNDVVMAIAHQPPPLRASFANAALAALEQGTPNNRADLESTAKIADADAENAARIAAAAAKYTAAMFDADKQREGIRWLEIWIKRAPRAAWDFIEARNTNVWRNDERMLRVLGSLSDDVGGLDADPALLARMTIAAYAVATPATDTRLSGEVTTRHRAQDFRRYIMDRLANTPSLAARLELKSLFAHPELKGQEDMIHWRLDQQADRAVKPDAWREGDVATLAASYETPPRTVDDLFLLVLRRLAEVRDKLNGSQWDQRAVVRAMPETQLRRWLGEKLEDRSNGWFSITQESVTVGENRTDLRLENRTTAGGVVVIEIKVASMRSWGGQELVDKVETQLVDQYLTPSHSVHGIYLSANSKGRAHWTLDQAGQVDYAGLLSEMQARMGSVAARRPELRLALFDLAITPD